MTVNISEFEAAVADFEDVVLQVDGGWDDREHLDMRRRHVLALHRQAKQAGLREIRQRALNLADDFNPWSEDQQNRSGAILVRLAIGSLVVEIDAMLNGGDDAK